MIQDVDETLRRLMAGELAKIPRCPVYHRDQISFDPPSSAEAIQDGTAHVNLYLHDVRENLELRDESFRVMRSERDGVSGRRRAPARLSLSYLVTVYAGDDPATEHRLLSDVLGVLLRCLAVPAEYLSGTFEGAGTNALPLEVAQPDNAAFADPASLWQALGGRLRPALSLKVTASFDPFETKWTKLVREIVTGFKPFSPDAQGENTVPNSATDGMMTRVGAAGIVLDQKTEEPLANVTIAIEGRDETVRTDERGIFLLNVAPGACTLRVGRRGYRGLEIKTSASSGRPEHLEPLVVALHAMTDAERAQEETALVEAMLGDERRVTAQGKVAKPDKAKRESAPRELLSGTLRYADGSAASYVSLSAGAHKTVTDGQGAYCFVNLPRGEVPLMAHIPGRGAVEVAAKNGTATIAVNASSESAPPSTSSEGKKGGRARDARRNAP